MSTIEERVVSMKFDGNQFLSLVDKSLNKLDQLNNKLKMTEGTKGFDQVGAAAARQSGALAKIASGVEAISGKFKALGIVGVAALSSIASQAVFAGENMIKNLAFGPLTDGFHEYETNLNAIQTILSNTAAAGTNLQDVNKALNDLNHYSDQTIYNFSQMAKNIGTFTAAGVGLDKSVASIKGLANLAALSGSNSEQASQAMYQLSQAISSGKVSLEDWNSVVNAGMGGTVFQRALAINAEKMGTLSKGAVKLKGDMKNVTIEGKSFRDSITAKPGQQSWLTSDVLTQTLAQFTGDLTDAQLKAEGFNDAEIKAIQSQAKMAKNAATQVKTLSQLLNTVKESIGSGWAQTWQTVFGDFGEARTLFTNVNNVLSGFVSASAKARNKVLADWKALGGRTAIINAIGNAFNALIGFLKPIREAFREVFPATTGRQLADISKSIERFTQNLKISGTTANNLKRTFAGFFAVLDIGWQIIKQVVKTIFDLLGVATQGTSGFLNFTGSIGDFLVGLDKAIKNGKGLKQIFSGIEKVLSAPIKLIKLLAGYLGSLFEGFNGSQAAQDVAKFTSALNPLGKLGSVLGVIWGHATVVFGNVWKAIQKVGEIAQKIFGPLANQITNALTGLDYKDFLNTINTGLFGGLVLLVKKFIDHFKNGGGGGILDAFKESIDGLTGTLEGMQSALKATALLEIAAAIGILAVSLNILSKIDAAGLARGSAAIGVMFGQLIGALILFQKFGGFTGFAKMPFIAASMILMATAVNILASAATKLASLDWNGLAKGLTGLTVILAALVATMQLMPDGKRMIASSLGMIAMAAAVKILVSAVTDLAGQSWEELGKGLLGVAGILGALALFSKFVEADKAGVLSGVGLLLLAAGIKILASAVTQMADLSWGEIARGLVTMAGALVIMIAGLNAIPPTAPLAAAGVLIVAISLGQVANALQKMASMGWGEILKSLVTMLGALGLIAAALTVIPPTAALGAAGILIVAVSLGMIGDALEKFSQFSWQEIAKAMVVLGGSLAIIAIAMAGMTEAIPGAAALVIVAGSLAILTPVLLALGSMSWEEILKGLVALAGALTVIGVAAAVLTPVIPSLIGLGAGIALLGAAMALAGAGVFLFATGLTLLAASGVAAASALVGMVNIILGAVPQIVKLVGALLVALADMIIQAAPKLGEAFMAILNTVIKVVGSMSPKIVDLILKLATALLETLLKYAPRMSDAGAKLITAILNGIAKRIGGIVTAATNVAVAFINGISKNLPRIINAGLNLIISFTNGLANGIRSHTAAMQAAGRNLAMAIIDGMTGGLASGVGRIVSMAKTVASSALSAAKAVLGIHSPSKEFEKIGNYVNDGFRKGLDGNKGQIDAAFNTLKNQIKSAMTDSAKDVVSLTTKLKKLQDARHKDRDEINETKKALAQAKKEHKAEVAAYNEVTKALANNHTKLGALANQYDVLTTKIKSAQDALADATKTRDDFNKSINDQFSAATAPTADDTVTDYIATLQKQVEDTKSFANVIQQLRKAGLNDDAYKQLLQAGIADLPFAKNLLAGGKDAINQVNALQKQLDTTASSLGQVASTQLYQAAVDSAAGLVKGLQKQQAAIEKQMDIIADAMVKSIKKKLGIKSPSKVFGEIGKFSAQGLSKGLENNVDIVAGSAETIANKAVEAMRVSLSNVDKMVAGNIDLQPTIQPVLDLTDIQKNAGKLSDLISSNAKMSVVGAYSAAVDVANAVRDRQSVDGSDGTTGTASTLNYTQNNYSPKAIGAVELYRNTKNQLSTVKGALST